jgi:DNA-binding transcriptional MerR regulator
LLTNDPLTSNYIPEHELANLLGVSRRTLRRWDALGLGPNRTKVGNRIFYRRATTERWLLGREQRARRAS